MLDSFYLDPNAVTGPDPLGILLVAVIAYFCGCFNGAVIVSKYILRDDVRNHGSGNAGLTNFYRTFGGPLTLVVILCDVLKAVVAVLLGSWLLGTALSQILCDNGHETYLWSHNPAKAAEMVRTRENPLLKGVHLSEALRITGDLDCLKGADLVVSAPPSFAVRETAKKMAPYLTEKSVVVSVSKGIERDTNLRLSQVIGEETGNLCPVVALSGPSHAEEVGIRMPTGCVAACRDADAARFAQDAFMNDYFRVYTSGDIVGVELAGALKNVIALSCGVCDGLGYQDNTKALLMTRAMAEITRLGEKLGGSRQTFGGLAGMGDLIVTCTSMHSRNRRAGILIGQGKTPQEAMKEVGAVVEGYFAALSIHQLSQRTGVEMPISRCAYEVLYEGKQVKNVVTELMTRAKKDELLETVRP